MVICSAAIAARRRPERDRASRSSTQPSRSCSKSAKRESPSGLQPLDQIVRQLLWHHRQPLQAEPRSHRPRHRLHRTRPHDQRPAKGRADHHRGAPLHGQNRAGHQHRAERGRQPQSHRGHLQPGNEQGVAAAPHAGLAGLGRPAEAADRLPGPRRPGKAAEGARGTGRVAHLYRRLGGHLAGRDARQGAAAQAERRRPRPGRGGLPAADVGHAALGRRQAATKTAPRKSRPSRAA